MAKTDAVGEKLLPDSGQIHVRRSRMGLWAMGLFPLVILGVIVYAFLTKGSSLVGAPPVPADALLRLGFERVIFEPYRIVAKVRNTGPTQLTIAQVLVNEAIWDFTISPADTLPRLGSATLSVSYPWLETEPVELTVITSNG
ncbi:MAG: hypothetical protein ACE5JS_00990, partial [Nitrospinota bacterium]